MKKLMAVAVFLLMATPAFASYYRENYNDEHVSGYTRSDGTYVDSYYRRCPGCNENE